MFGFGSAPKKYEDVEVNEFQELMHDKDAVVLDVRTPMEKGDGVIPGYKMINLMSPDFSKEIEKLDKSKKYLVYCRSGNRSGQACQIMARMGFEHLYNLAGGISAWNRIHRNKVE